MSTFNNRPEKVPLRKITDIICTRHVGFHVYSPIIKEDTGYGS